jgi:thymidylate synthase (FAD)
MSVIGKEVKILDHGYVRCVDVMGDDYSIEEAARTSYGKGTRKKSQTKGLIDYLTRNWHNTPREMVEFKFHCKMPIFVARQWIRHRTANVNEYSARYSILDKDYYVPEIAQLKIQDPHNKQASGKQLPKKQAEQVQNSIRETSEMAYVAYEQLLDKKVSREIARMVLPTNYYTQWYWKIDLHNLFHFLRLRDDAHAQWEIRQYAIAIASMVKEHCPMAYSAYERYIKNSISLSQTEQEALKKFFNIKLVEDAESLREFFPVTKTSNEFEDFKKKLKLLVD